MNKINPIYIMLLFIVVLIISFVKVNESMTNLQTTQNDFEKFKTEAIHYNKLISNNSSKNIDNFTKSVSNNSIYKKEKIKINNKNNSVEFSFIGDKYHVYQKLINEILNNNFKIISLSIEKKSTKIEISRK